MDGWIDGCGWMDADVDGWMDEGRFEWMQMDGCRMRDMDLDGWMYAE